MKKNIICHIAILFSFFSFFAQTRVNVTPDYSKSGILDGYKYFLISEFSESGRYDKLGLKSEVSYILKDKFHIVSNEVLSNNSNIKNDYKKNPCLFARIKYDLVYSYGDYKASILIEDCYGNIVYKPIGVKGGNGNKKTKYLISVTKKLLNINYKYNPSAALIQQIDSNILNEDKFKEIDIFDESSIRSYFENNYSEGIEGVWEYTSTDDSEYKFLILKNNYIYNVIIIEGSYNWMPGQLKAMFEPTVSDEVFTIKWKMGRTKEQVKTIGTTKKDALIEFSIGEGSTLMYKVYPKLSDIKGNNKRKKGAWAGNGSGIIISQFGHIVTNHHVIENADEIEVEFILEQEVQKFNAEIISVDKTNDIAILKIVDANFYGIEKPTYNFKTRSSDVGTKVYAYGYPLALSIMGKEIKITDGIISSKSGFDGDITTYQITAPIQSGNSGGPLFDDLGNFIGINSSGINKQIAENVGYTIKSSYVLNLLDVLPRNIELPNNKDLQNLPLTEQIKVISKFVVLVKVK